MLENEHGHHLGQQAIQPQKLQHDETHIQHQQEEDEQQQQEKQRRRYSQRQQRQLLQPRSLRRERLCHGSTSTANRMLKNRPPLYAGAAAKVSTEGSFRYTARKDEQEDNEHEPTATDSATETEVRSSTVASGRDMIANAASTALDRLTEARERQHLAKQKLKGARRVRALSCMLAQKSENHATAVATAATQTLHGPVSVFRNRISRLKVNADLAVASARSLVAASKQKAAAAIAGEETATQELSAANTAVNTAEVVAAAEQPAAADACEEAGATAVPEPCSSEQMQIASPPTQQRGHPTAGSPAESAAESTADSGAAPAAPGTPKIKIGGRQEASGDAASGQETGDPTVAPPPNFGCVMRRENCVDTKEAGTREAGRPWVIQDVTDTQGTTGASGESNAPAALEARIATASAEAEGATTAAAALLDSAIKAPEVAAAAAAAATTDALLLSSNALPESPAKQKFVSKSDGLLAAAAAAAAAAMVARRARRRLPGRLTNRRRRIFAYCCRESIGDACTCTQCSSCKKETAAAPVPAPSPAAAAALAARSSKRDEGLQQTGHMQISLRSRRGRSTDAASVDTASTSSISSRNLRKWRGTRKRERRCRSSFPSPSSDESSSVNIDSSSGSDWEGTITRRKSQPQYRRHQDASAPTSAAAPCPAAALRRAEALAFGGRADLEGDPVEQRQQLVSLSPVVAGLHKDRSNVSNAGASTLRSARSGLRSSLQYNGKSRYCPTPVVTDQGPRLLPQIPSQHCGTSRQKQGQQTASPRSSCRILRSHSRHPAAAAAVEGAEATLEMNLIKEKPLTAPYPSSGDPLATGGANESALPATPDTISTEPADAEEGHECPSSSRCNACNARQPKTCRDHCEASSTDSGIQTPFKKRSVPFAYLRHEEHEQEEQCEHEELAEQQRRRQPLPVAASIRSLRGNNGVVGRHTAAAETDARTVESTGVSTAPAAVSWRNYQQEHQRNHQHRESDASALPLETAPLILEDFRELLLSLLRHPKQQHDTNLPQTRKGSAAAILAASSHGRNNGSMYNTPSKSSHDACNRKYRSVRSAAAAVAAATAAQLQARGPGGPKDFKADVEAAAAEIAKNISWNEKRRSYAAKIRGVSQPVWFAAKRRGVPQALQAAANLLIEDVQRRRPTQLG